MAHREIDLANPKTNRRNAGFTDQEREGLSNLLAEGFLDTFRHLYPEKTGAYSWWSYRARDWAASNRGRRLDHIWTSHDLAPLISSVAIHSDLRGAEKPSDHVPVVINL